MDQLRSMRAFVEVARSGSFARAATRLGRSTSSVSRQVMDLETWLGAPVFRRTTRRLTLTDAGGMFLPRCAGVVEAADGIERDAAAMAETPQGALHVASAPFLARHRMVPHLPEFAERFPAVRLRLHLDDHPVDLVGEGMDLAIRVGTLEDSALVTRRIGQTRLLLTASPAFLKEQGTPTSVGEISSYPCLVDTVPSHGNRWPLASGLPVDGPVTANDGEIIRDLTLAGLGISFLPDFFVEDDVRAGRLVGLFEEEIDHVIGIHVIYPPRRQITAAARTFAGFLAERLSAPKNKTAPP